MGKLRSTRRAHRHTTKHSGGDGDCSTLTGEPLATGSMWHRVLSDANRSYIRVHKEGLRRQRNTKIYRDGTTLSWCFEGSVESIVVGASKGTRFMQPVPTVRKIKQVGYSPQGLGRMGLYDFVFARETIRGFICSKGCWTFRASGQDAYNLMKMIYDVSKSEGWRVKFSTKPAVGYKWNPPVPETIEAALQSHRPVQGGRHTTRRRERSRRRHSRGKRSRRKR